MWRAVLLSVLLASAAALADPEAPVVARGHLRGAGSTGSVFFVPVAVEPGVAAVGAAHSFDRTRLAESGELELRLPSGPRIASSRRYFTKPGRPFHRPGATLRDDFVIFALAAPPEEVRILELAPELPAVGDRVRLLGIPANGQRQAELAARVVRSEPSSIEIELPGRPDLRGWGGAPLLDADGRVLGLLQSAWPAEQFLRAGVGPIGGVAEALAEPFEGGLGRLFSTLAPPASAANSPVSRRRAVTGDPFGAQDPARTARIVAAATRDGVATRPPAARALRVEIEYPLPDAQVGDAAGVFVAGRAVALHPEAKRFDIVVVIDTSISTVRPSGVDVNGDGYVGVPDKRRASTDPGDSILAAEVAAAGRLLDDLDPRSTRVGIVSFAGHPVGRMGLLGVRLAALTEEPLTSDYVRLRRGLERVLERSADGMTHMAAGIDQATLELLGLDGSISSADPESEKIVLFFTDGAPTLPHPDSESGNVRAVLESALRARRAGVRIHSFAIGPEALAGPISTVEMAAITEGIFTPIRHPGDLVRFIEGVSLANLESVAVRNATAGEAAYQVRVQADGSWDALVPLRPGENRIEARAVASDGTKALAATTVFHTPGTSAFIPAELAPRHNALLAARLTELRRERIEKTRRELVIEIEREREAALERAARQRKELELEIDWPESP